MIRPPLAPDDLPPPAPPARRRWPWVLVGLAVLLGGLWLALPSVIGQVIAATLRADTGVPARVSVVELSLGHLVIAPLVLGDDLLVERMTVRWRLPDLVRKRLVSVSLDHARVRLTVSRDGVSLGAVGRLLATQHMKPAVVTLADATAVVALPWGERQVPFRLTKSADTVTAEATITPLLSGADLAEGEVSLAVDAQLGEATTVAARLAGAPLSGAATLLWAGDGLTVTIDQPLRLALAAVPEDIAAAAPEPLAPLLAGPLRLAVAPGGSAGPTITWQGGERSLSADLRVELRSGDEATAVLDLRGGARLPAAGMPTLAFERLAVELTELPIGETRISGAVRLSDATGGAGGGAAALRAMLVATNFATEDVTADEAALSLEGALTVDPDGRLALTAATPGTLHLRGLALPGLDAPGPVTLALQPDAEPLAVLDTATWLLRTSLTLTAPAVTAELAGEPVRAEAVSLLVGGPVELRRGGTRPSIDIAAARGALPNRAVSLTEIAGRIELGQGRLHITVNAAQAVRRADGRNGLPLALTGWLGKQPDGALAFSVFLVDDDGRVDLQATGRHDPDSHAGHADITLDAVTFAPGGLQPRALFPELPAEVTEVSGVFAVAGGIDWRNGRHRPNLNVMLKDMDGNLGGVELLKLNSVVKLTGLDPLTTPRGQLLAVGLIKAGLPLTDGQVLFRLRDGRLEIEQGTTHLAGGTVGLGQVEWVFGSTGIRRFSLDVSELDLGRLVELIDVDGLSATGTLAGRVPLSAHPDRLIIDDARLLTVESGAIRYQPKEPPAFFQAGESTRLVLKAFDNFVYDKLIMTLNGAVGEELVAGLHITGANPGLYGGYPIEFNLNLSGKLDRIIDEALIGYQIPEQIRQRMSGFGVR